jgi:phospholipase D-like protein
MPQFIVLQRYWKNHLADLLSKTELDILISSPFITRHGVDFVSEHVSSSVKTKGRITIITDLSSLNISQGSTDPQALRTLTAIAPEVKVYHLPRLHAKVYIADVKRAIVTSGNLTAGGLTLNYEYGLWIEHASTVKAVRQDIAQYAELGASLSADQLAIYCQVAEQVRMSFRKQQSTVARSARQAFEAALQSANDELIRFRLAVGPVHTIFSKTILYLLNREGPLKTEEIHLLIEAIHPDLCDNTIDRVIDGERFGKKWKHAVRTAQQNLKKKGLIELRDGKWKLSIQTNQ